MRKRFAELIYKLLQEDKSLFVLTADLGMFVWDKAKADFPNRFLNVGASEQAMLDIAVGMAYSGKKVICYSITPFLLYRPFETIRTYINHEKLPILLVGSGRNNDYVHDGWSHDGSDDKAVMSLFSNIKSYWPEDDELDKVCSVVLQFKEPSYLNLKK